MLKVDEKLSENVTVQWNEDQSVVTFTIKSSDRGKWRGERRKAKRKREEEADRAIRIA